MGAAGTDYRRSTMVDETQTKTDAEALAAWMKANCRQQQWRALDKRGKPRVYTACLVEMSRNKVRLALNVPHARLDAAIKEVFESGKARPIGRMLPLESNQTQELWMVNR